jgi:adenylate cyclase
VYSRSIDAAGIIRWLTNEAPVRDPAKLIEELASRLMEAGVPVARVRAALFHMHPESYGLGASWDVDRGTMTRAAPRADIDRQRNDPSSSPIGEIMTDRFEYRARLDAEPPAYKALAEARAEGFTDYFLVGLPMLGGRPDGDDTVLNAKRTWASFFTRAESGFSDAHLELLRAIRPTLAVIVELASGYHGTTSLLEVYLGKDAARRVTEGKYKRGTGELMRAAIWTCDLRGFTSRADHAPLGELVATLDRYFEAVAAPIAAGGGEILKLIGDAALAVFVVGDDPSSACARALTAAEGAIAATAALGLEIGVGLHLGDVMYGNIGARARLDFTVIGRAVNEVTRVESLCKTLGVPLLATGAFTGTLPAGTLASLGHHPLRGVAEPVELLTLPRYAARSR